MLCRAKIAPQRWKSASLLNLRFEARSSGKSGKLNVWRDVWELWGEEMGVPIARVRNPKPRRIPAQPTRGKIHMLRGAPVLRFAGGPGEEWSVLVFLNEAEVGRGREGREEGEGGFIELLRTTALIPLFQ